MAGDQPTVLVADDISMMGELLRTILRRAGCEVVASATNGDDAVRAFHRHRPDLVFMDINMPGKSGLEALQEIMGNDADAFVVLVSVESSVSFVQEAMDLGAKGFLVKPVSARKVESLVQRFRQASPPGVPNLP